MSARDVNEPEGTGQPRRTTFIRETTIGEAPADPSHLRFSDNIDEITFNVGENKEAKQNLGQIDSDGIFRGPNQAEASVSYHLQRSLSDAATTPDAATDFILRDSSSNRFLNTHTLVDRIETFTGGTDGAGVRAYFVGLGGKGTDGEIELDPDAPSPIPSEINYRFERGDVYRLNQPSSAEAVEVTSTNADDDGKEITVEDEGAATSETLTLSSSTPPTSTATYDDIDAVWMPEDPIGDVTVSLGTSGSEVVTLFGGETHSDGAEPVEGDYGVPALGAGSIEAALNTGYEHFPGPSIYEQAAGDLEYDLINLVFSWENELDETPRDDNQRMRLTEGNRTITTEGTFIGNDVSYAYAKRALSNAQTSLNFVLAYSDITIKENVIMESADGGSSADASTNERSITYQMTARDDTDTAVADPITIADVS